MGLSSSRRLVSPASLRRTVTAALAEQVAARPGAPALSHDGSRWTFADLDADVARAAAGLSALGVAAGDRVTVYAGSIPEQVLTFLAVARLGGINAPVNAQWLEEEARWVLQDSGAKVLVVSLDSLERGLAACEGAAVEHVVVVRRSAEEPDIHDAELPAGVRSFDDLLAHEPLVRDGAEPDDPVALFYTSGTTGRPKGATWTHTNLLYNSLAWMDVFGVGEHDVALGGYDGRGSGISIGVTGPLLVGAHVRSLARRGLDPAGMITSIADGGITYMPTAPAIMSILMQVARQAGVEQLPTVEVIAIGSAPTPPDLFEPLRAFLPRCRIFHSYGASEGHFSACPPEALPEKAGSVGLPLPESEIRVVDDSMVDVPRGEVGRVAVRGPGIMAGYWNNPEATATALREGWLLMGDLGRLDADGFLWLVGRDRDVINSGGWNVYATEVEAVVASLPGVQYAAVVGRPDPVFGQRVVAYVAPFPGQVVDPAAVEEACRVRLAKYKRPREVHVRETLPVNANLKVLKHLIDD